MLRSFTRRTLTVAVAATLAAGSLAHAAGLGRLSVQSALGQPLRAEVEISAPTREELASLSARLASAEAFRQAGLDYPAFLQTLRLSVERRGDGRHVVRIVSTQPVSEPFVDLLVELSWANGRLLREYTFLLDPPEIAGRPDARTEPQTVVPAASAGEPASATEPAPSARPAPRRADAPMASDTGDYRVRPGDTLMGIAQGTRAGAARPEQVAAAIYRDNPRAFAGSPDLLREGSQLRLPDEARALAVPPAQARRELRLDAAEREALRAATGAAPRRVESAAAGRGATGRIGAAPTETAPPANDRLELSRAAAGSEGGSRAGTDRSRDAEQRAARDAALAESASRVRDLERNVADLRRLLELKDQSLAGLQRRLEEAERASTTATGRIARDESAKRPVETAAVRPEAAANAPATEAPVNKPAADAPGSKQAADATAAGPTNDGAAARAAEAPAPVDASPARADATPPVESAVAAGEVPAPAADPSPAAPAATDASGPIVSQSWFLPVAGSAAALLAGAGLLIAARRRRARASDRPEETIEPVVVPAPVPEPSAGALSEVDPIAEAEVYLAYGREQQAEGVLREALAADPTRHPVRLRLLELLAARQDVDAFNAAALPLHELTGGHDPAWTEAAVMGARLDPAHPLYADHAAPTDQALPVEAEPEFVVTDPVPVAESVADDATPEMAAPEDRPADSTLPDLDFPAEREPARGADTMIEQAVEQLAERRDATGDDFDLSLPPLEPTERPVEAVEPIDPSLLDFDLDLPPARPATETAAATASDLPDLDVATAPVGDAQWQEMATKLDLAAAYDEIGDREGARELLEEVLRDGDDLQRDRARDLLGRLG